MSKVIRMESFWIVSCFVVGWSGMMEVLVKEFVVRSRMEFWIVSSLVVEWSSMVEVSIVRWC